ncbi:MAG: hypothetical protein A3F67_00985 [Verrucomicrobia bacterium RIFCSPHIGHO2_12_FULL_41_10]|nr:MAG: hypothetical protein A3F67_00985 [Verrucomicrobia bacterium RIFCSPHIGHO2_12_FULL_41_10]
MSLHKCKKIKWEGFINEIGDARLNHLEKIDLSKTGITAEALVYFLQRATQLKEISLGHCKKINWETFNQKIQIEKNPSLLRQLKKIDVRYTNITLAEVQHLQKCLPHLKIYHSISEYVSSISTEEKPFPIHTPAFNPEGNLDYKPSDHREWSFDCKNDSFDQGMIQNKLVQYLIVTDHPKKEEWKPTILNGICQSLSELFLENNNDWQQELEWVKQWDGEKNSLTDNIENFFKKLLTFFESYYINNKRNPIFYQGDHWLALLNPENVEKIFLSNTWHTVAIKKHEENGIFYDPNCSEGSVLLPPNQLGTRVSHSLGTQIAANIPPTKPITIQSQNRFLAGGGLFHLVRCLNTEAILKALTLSPKEVLCLKSLKNGLILRNTSAVPAWIDCLSSTKENVPSYVYRLLIHYLCWETNEDPYAVLKKSISDIRVQDIAFLWGAIDKLNTLAKTCQENSLALKNLMTLIEEKIHDLLPATAQEPITPDDKDLVLVETAPLSFKPWEKIIPTQPDVIAFIQDLTKPNQHNYRKILLDVSEQSALQPMALHLIDAAQKNYSVFYANTPEELYRLPDTITTDDKGAMTIHKNQPSGKLLHFLHTHSHQPIFLIVNFSTFSDEERMQFKSMLDDSREVDGVTLPECTTLIGLTDNTDTNQRVALRGFDECFMLNNDIPCYADLVSDFTEDNQQETPTVAITLALLGDEEKWESLLLGSFIFSGEGLVFRKGLLEKAIEEKATHLVLENAPWHHLPFRAFMAQLLHDRQFTDAAGHEQALPDTLQFFRKNSRDPNLSPDSSTSHFDEKSMYLVNSSLLSGFLTDYDVDKNTGYCSTADGLLEKLEKNGVTAIAVMKTHCMPGNEIEKLETNARQHNITLHWRDGSTGNPPMIPCESVQVYVTTDVDQGLSQLQLDKKVSAEAMVIDVTGMEPYDLSTKVRCEERDNLARLKLHQTTGWLSALLAKGEPVVLKGSFSQEFAEMLAPFLMHSPHGKLIIVSDGAEPLRFVTTQTIISAAAPLEEKQSNDTETFSHQAARARFATLASVDPWHGFHDTSTADWLFDEKQGNGADDFTGSRDFAENYEKTRTNQIDALFAISPYVFLSGPSGGGKTTFVKNVYCHDAKLTCFEGLPSLKAWAFADQGVLFIDEANLDPNDWMLFDGLFQKPAGMVVDGEWKPIDTKTHQVIFAGNPTTDGNRHMAKLFQQRGGALHFAPMPPLYLYERVLKPIFNGRDESSLRVISQALCYVYECLIQQSIETLLVTPREMGMIALAIRATSDWPTHEDALKQWTYQMARPFLPTLPEKIVYPTQSAVPDSKMSDAPVVLNQFILTSAYERAYQQLTHYFSIRELRIYLGAKSNNQAPSATLDNKIFQRAGLGGFVLEGEPGIGKTHFIREYLEAQGVIRGNENKKNDDEKNVKAANNTYYVMPASASPDDAQRLLRKALHEGAILVVDQLNSIAPRIEAELNAALMGQDTTGAHATHPGFLLLGSQNPSSFGGGTLSPALAHRMSMSEVPPYSKKEMESILQTKGLTQAESQLFVHAFSKNKNEGERTGQTLLPTFSDLLKAVDRHKKERENLNTPQKNIKTISFFQVPDEKNSLRNNTAILSIQPFLTRNVF